MPTLAPIDLDHCQSNDMPSICVWVWVCAYFFNKHWRANFAVYNHVWGRGRGYVCVKIENNNHFVVICSCSNRWRISETYCLHTKEQHTHKLLDKHVQCGYAYTYTAVSTLFWFYFCFCLWVCVDLILNPNFTCNMPKRWHTLTHSLTKSKSCVGWARK